MYQSRTGKKSKNARNQQPQPPFPPTEEQPSAPPLPYNVPLASSTHEALGLPSDIASFNQQRCWPGQVFLMQPSTLVVPQPIKCFSHSNLRPYNDHTAPSAPHMAVVDQFQTENAPIQSHNILSAEQEECLNHLLFSGQNPVNLSSAAPSRNPPALTAQHRPPNELPQSAYAVPSSFFGKCSPDSKIQGVSTSVAPPDVAGNTRPLNASSSRPPSRRSYHGEEITLSRTSPASLPTQYSFYCGSQPVPPAEPCSLPTAAGHGEQELSNVSTQFNLCRAKYDLLVAIVKCNLDDLLYGRCSDRDFQLVRTWNSRIEDVRRYTSELEEEMRRPVRELQSISERWRKMLHRLEHDWNTELTALRELDFKNERMNLDDDELDLDLRVPSRDRHTSN